ncbi:MAG: efflux RND transporter periplasmic adaptor subunit, partial [Cyclobacteriaceae bacterium]
VKDIKYIEMKVIKNIPQWLRYGLLFAFGLLVGWYFFHGKSAETHDHAHDHQPTDGEATVWTCSMHPQIRQQEPGKCPLCAMDLIPASKAGGGSVNPLAIEMSPSAMALANIQTTKVEAAGASNESTLTLNGKIAANEQRRFTLSADYSGRVDRLYVNFTGQAVSSGQKLANIYAPELIVAQKELQEAQAIKSRNPEMFEAARQKLLRWRLTEAQIDNLITNGEIKTNFDLYATASGIVTGLLIKEGDYVGAGTPMVEIADLSNVWVLIDAYERDLASIGLGSKVSFDVSAFPGKKFEASITWIDPIIDPETRIATLRAEASNNQFMLKPGMFVRAQVRTGKSVDAASVIQVPASAVLWTGKRSLVYVKTPVTEMPSFEMREVVLGNRSGVQYQILGGLNPGEEIVTNGVFSVDAAAQLLGKHSMMNPELSKKIEVPDQFQVQVTDLAKAYFEVKNHLVSSDAIQAKSSLDNVFAALNEVKTIELSEKAINEWKALHQKMDRGIKDMQKSVELSELRLRFETLSEAMLELVATFGTTLPVVYEAYCPMVDGNRGASWLSEKEEIYNPYFGDKMLHCGENTRVFAREKESNENNKQIPQHLHH